jgi:Secretion system C-terminal sorting domain
MKKALLALVLAFAFSLQAQTEVVVTANISANTTWTANNVYILDGYVFVDSLATLTINPGTIIRAKQSTQITQAGETASALIVRRGAKLMAEGTKAQPIIFTSNVNNGTGLTAADRGLWGGLIFLGRATTSNPSNNKLAEGLPTTAGAYYGGNLDNDSSGSLKYVSVRHPGAFFNGVSGSEINGVTCYACGSGTVLENVEVFASSDDGFEFFGGTVNTRFLASIYNADDGFDWDEGFRGKHQFWFCIMATDEAGRCGEHDGGPSNNLTGTPYSLPIVSNVTYIGSNSARTTPPSNEGNDRMIFMRDNTGGKYYNSIIMEGYGVGIKIEDVATSTTDARSQLESNSNIVIKNNIFYNLRTGATVLALSGNDAYTETHLNAQQNVIANPQLASICWTGSNCLDPRPLNNTALAASGAIPVGDAYFINVGYRGAFGSRNWLNDWNSAAKQYGVLANISTDVSAEEVPNVLSLDQNYPNPFSGKTNISFGVSQTENVRLALYNMAGQLIAVLAEGVMEAGMQEVQLDAQGLANGTYVLRLNNEKNSINRLISVVK